MSQQIIIEGDLVRLVQITTERSITLADWLPSIERRPPVYTPVLPRATRALWYDPSENASHKMVIMMEVEPQVTHLNKNGRIHRLMMPWTRFIFYCTMRGGFGSNVNESRWRMEDYRVFWSKDRYTKPDAEDMIRALLPNVYEDGRICFGTTAADADQTIADRLDQTVNEFYATEFNDDLGVTYPNGFRGFRAWASATTRDQLGWMQWTDLQTDNFNHTHYSWNRIFNDWSGENVHRNNPVVTPDPIPPLHLTPSFGRALEWASELTITQRNRLRLALGETLEDEPVNETEDNDWDDNPDEDGEM